MTDEQNRNFKAAIAAMVDARIRDADGENVHTQLLEVAAGLIERVAYDTASQRSSEETMKLLTLAAELQRLSVSRLS